MTFESIRGQDGAIQSIRRALGRGRLSHALIFAGPGGVGKGMAAHALATALFCKNDPGLGCGACEDCHLMETGGHPDLFVEDLARAREEKPTASRLSIDQIRRTRSQLAMRGVRGNKKVGLIDQAELLSIDAQNALLKTLEEPPGETTLVLVSTNADALLTTIRSRCQTLLFAPLERELLQELLVNDGTDPEVAKHAAALAEGSLDRARSLAAEGGLEYTAELRGKLATLPKLRLPQVLDLAAELAAPRGEKGQAQQQLNRATVLDWCRDQLLEAARATESTDAAGTDDEAEAHDRLHEIRRALRRADRAYAINREFERNANSHLAWDRLLLDLRESR
ncbi:MAG: DNA polymerase III subunit delta' [Candidatus Binatia bacterium]|nr:DNA polymerase III subunit delta' [Candidatus Binatia bacterium]